MRTQDTRELDPQHIDVSFVPRPRGGITTAELDGEAVLYHEGTGRIHALDTIATIVWSCFDGAATVHDIVGELAGAFQAERVVVENDVLALVRRLGAEGLLDGVAADDAAVADLPAGGDAVAYEELDPGACA